VKNKSICRDSQDTIRHFVDPELAEGFPFEIMIKLPKPRKLREIIGRWVGKSIAFRKS